MGIFKEWVEDEAPPTGFRATSQCFYVGNCFSLLLLLLLTISGA